MKYVIYLKESGLWMGAHRHWVQRLDQALRFDTFQLAVEACEGYDVIIKTVEK